MSHQMVLLMVQDQPLRQTLTGFFERLGFLTQVPLDQAELLHLIADEWTRMAIVESRAVEGREVLNTARHIRPSLPMIMVVEPEDVDLAVAYMRGGALDCLAKPVDLHRLGSLVKANIMLNVNDTVSIDHPQREIRGYRILCEIGGGSMGVIYLAADACKRVALKVLRHLPQDPEERAEMRERFQREARAAASVDHPNVVRIHDYGFDDDQGVAFIAMELLTGIPLLEYAERQPELDFRARTRIMLQVAHALAAIHQHGICHRDIKPANILVDADGHAKVTDFGVAYVPGSDLTVSGEMIGSPAYMAPEAFESARIDARADIFSLAIVIYEFFLGVHPFMGRGIAETAAKISHDKPTEPMTIDEKFPPRLQIMLGKMLRKSAKDRYQSMGEVITEMQAFLDDLSGKSTGVWSRPIRDVSRAVLRQDWS